MYLHCSVFKRAKLFYLLLYSERHSCTLSLYTCTSGCGNDLMVNNNLLIILATVRVNPSDGTLLIDIMINMFIIYNKIDKSSVTAPDTYDLRSNLMPFSFLVSKLLV